jgi:putative nucleotide binding protein
MSESDATPVEDAIVLDYLPHGRADDDRPGYQKPPIAFVLDSEHFTLHELTLTDDSGVKIGDRLDITSPPEGVERVHTIDYEDLSSGARSELEYVIEDLIEEEEDRFVSIYNDAQPITLRLHQLNLLPGIGKKLRNTILDERKRRPFEDFEDLDDRVTGLHDPQGVLADRILEELREDELKYRLFVREQ